MIRHGESLPKDESMEVDVAIIGAGPVGLAIATRLMGRVGRIALIEAGGAHFEPTQNLEFFKAAEIDDSRHLPTELNRRRMLGGTTSVWGGRCIPFDPEDFAPALERPGWPIAFTDVDAHIAKALEFLDAGKPAFRATSALPAPRLSLEEGDLVVDRIERYSKPTNVWRKWRSTLTQSRDVTVIYGTTCTSVITNAEGSRAIAIELKTAPGQSYRIRASTIVLACGGLETPRLMLASRASHPCGLGNEHDLVGRFYMTHLVSDARNVGTLQFASPAMAHAFDFTKTSDGIYGRRMLLISPVARQRERLGNIVFRPTRPPIDDPSHGDPVLSAMFLARKLLIPAEYMRSLAVGPAVSPAFRWRAHVANIAPRLPGLLGFSLDWLRRRVLATRKLPSVFLYRTDGTYPLEFNAEQMPNPQSRVLLGDETDSFGMPRLIVRWQIHDSELAWICRAYQVMAAATTRAGLGIVRLEFRFTGRCKTCTSAPRGTSHRNGSDGCNPSHRGG